MFDRKRPCANCPFTRANAATFGLPDARILEIVQGPAFQCHKTVNYEEYDDPNLRQGDHPQQCAGLMALLHAEDSPNQIMQVGERMGAFDPNALDTSDTFESIGHYRRAARGAV